MLRTTILIAALVVASPALAHSKLVAATPAANATVGKTGKLTLMFNERLMPQFSGATIAMPAMANHAPMPVAAIAKVAADGKTMTITPARPLGAGTYRVDWHSAGIDMHKLTGSYSFTVK